MLCDEIFIPGRIAMGEYGVYDAVSLITEGCAAATSEPHWRDTLLLAPGACAGETEVTIGTLFGLPRAQPADALVDALHWALMEETALAGLQWGVSDLPDGSGVIVRIVGKSSRAVQAAHQAAWHCLRMHTLGCPAPEMRRT